MIRGIVYLTGLVTLAVVGVVAAFAFKVHKWPWKEYIETGRREIAETLDPDDGNRDVQGRTAAFNRDTQDIQDGERRASGSPVNPWSPRAVHKPSVPLVRRHVVRRDETLYAIASRFYGAGERWPEIARANDIRRPSDLRVGRAIVVPYDTVAFEDRTDGMWVPDLRLRFATAVGTTALNKDKPVTQDSERRVSETKQ